MANKYGRLSVTFSWNDPDSGSGSYSQVYALYEVDNGDHKVTYIGQDEYDVTRSTPYIDLDWTDTTELDAVFAEGYTMTYTWLTPMTEVDDDSSIEFPISIANGGTGATTASQALVNLGAASASHTHTQYAAASHTHDYAATNHTHSNYAAANHSHNYAASSHSHTIANITNLQSMLDGKAATGHSHGNTVLWSGGSYMGSSHIANLSQKISEQDHGIAIVFSGYDTSKNTPLNNSWTTHFVPKEMIQYNNGGGQTFLMAINSGMSDFGSKYLYIEDDKIMGHVSNTQAGTGASGITFSNNKYVMRYVIGF